MSTATLHAPLDNAHLGLASSYILETREAMLEYDREELAALRFSIILTARWAASEEAADRRAELRQDLKLLRQHFGDKVDDLAMTYGIDQAMAIKNEVEHSVVVPRDVKPIAADELEYEGCSTDDGENGYHDI